MTDDIENRHNQRTCQFENCFCRGITCCVGQLLRDVIETDDTMHDPEQVEKMRQAVMRLRELLDIMSGQLAEAERAYAGLFAHLAPEAVASLKEKERQGLAALQLLDDSSPLADAALNLRFVTRELERDFEQLYENIIYQPED